MTIQEIENLHKQVARCIEGGETYDAFNHLDTLVKESGRGNLNDELERLRMSYTFMLKYLEQGVKDPEREQILMGINQSLHTINDRCYIGLKEPISCHFVTSQASRSPGDKTLQSRVVNFPDFDRGFQQP